jgi:hypothetical protein
MRCVNGKLLPQRTAERHGQTVRHPNGSRRATRSNRPLRGPIGIVQLLTRPLDASAQLRNLSRLSQHLLDRVIPPVACKLDRALRSPLFVHQ